MVIILENENTRQYSKLYIFSCQQPLFSFFVLMLKWKLHLRVCVTLKLQLKHPRDISMDYTTLNDLPVLFFVIYLRERHILWACFQWSNYETYTVLRTDSEHMQVYIHYLIIPFFFLTLPSKATLAFWEKVV